MGCVSIPSDSRSVHQLKELIAKKLSHSVAYSTEAQHKNVTFLLCQQRLVETGDDDIRHYRVLYAATICILARSKEKRKH